jgi:hypothetical protein
VAGRVNSHLATIPLKRNKGKDEWLFALCFIVG